MNASRKGKRAQSLARAILEAEGYLVDEAKAVTARTGSGPRAFRSIRHDFWGAVDLAAMHPEKGLVYVQVTAGKGAAGKRADVGALPWPLALAEARGFPLAAEVWALARRRDDVDPRRTVSFFRVWGLQGDGAWAARPPRYLRDAAAGAGA